MSSRLCRTAVGSRLGSALSVHPVKLRSIQMAFRPALRAPLMSNGLALITQMSSFWDANPTVSAKWLYTAGAGLNCLTSSTVTISWKTAEYGARSFDFDNEWDTIVLVPLVNTTGTTRGVTASRLNVGPTSGNVPIFSKAAMSLLMCCSAGSAPGVSAKVWDRALRVTSEKGRKRPVNGLVV